MPPNEVVVVISFEIKMGTRAGTMGLCIPFNVIEPVMSKLSQQNWFTYSRKAGNEGQAKAVQKSLSGAPIEHVPYRGSGQFIPDLLAGRVDMTFISYLTIRELVKDGKLRILAAASKSRWAGLPDVPTMAEVGLPGFDLQTSLFALAPAGTPRPVIDLLYAEFGKALRDPEVLRKIAELGFTPVVSSPEQSAQRIKEELGLWAKVAREANLQQP